MSKVNLFHYATSELSQDAFICWLLAHGMEAHQAEDPLLYACALDFIRRVPGLENAQQIDEIKQQYLNIDVLVIVGDMDVIIEDKTYTNLHDNQIDVYTNSLVKKGIPQSRIRTVFYKIVEQPKRERVDREYTRSDILDILRKYKACKNDIFQDYLAHLEQIEARTEGFKRLPINAWGYDGTRGFFVSLQNRPSEYNVESWGYVSNASGGFMGMWFHIFDAETVLKAMGINEHVEDLYLQFENNVNFSGTMDEAEQAGAYILAVKLRANIDDKKDNFRDAAEIRRELYEDIKKKLPDFAKKTFRPGLYMTVGYLTYDEKNYDRKAADIKTALNTVVAEWVRGRGASIDT